MISHFSKFNVLHLYNKLVFIRCGLLSLLRCLGDLTPYHSVFTPSCNCIMLFIWKKTKQVKELIPFENDPIVLMRNIKFGKKRNHSQKKLRKDIQLTKLSHKTVKFADKINLYWFMKVGYDRLTNSAITSKYKKTSNIFEK